MTTKEQERKALEKIRKIIDDLGENSYIGTAFEGCFQDAENNIEWDAAFSMSGRLELAEEQTAKQAKEIERLKAEIRTMKEQNTFLQQEIETAKHDRNVLIQKWNDDRKDIEIKVKDRERETKPFKSMKYNNNDGFQFITIEEKNGWMTSYKMEDIEVLNIF